jgi:hypothetical protein
MFISVLYGRYVQRVLASKNHRVITNKNIKIFLLVNIYIYI